jgi:hypothetical protein
MSIDAYLEFQNENTSRAFPIREDMSRLDNSGSDYVLPNDVLLDVRGFTRSAITVEEQLYAIVGGSSSPTDPALSPSAGNWRFYFKIGNSELIFTDVPETNQTWPFTSIVYGLSPNTPTGETKEYEIRMAAGSGLTNIDSLDFHIFEGTAKLEDTLIARMNAVQVDPIRIVHVIGSDEYVGGENLVLKAGYNMQVQSVDGGITLAAIPGAGEGYPVDPVISAGDSACEGKLYSLNDAKPNEVGALVIEAGTGIKIVNAPDQNKIFVRRDLATVNGRLVCP